MRSFEYLSGFLGVKFVSKDGGKGDVVINFFKVEPNKLVDEWFCPLIVTNEFALGALVLGEDLT